ncbi:glyoxalase [Streptomyces albiflavescens]|uniref:Glyoxalase n=1 Tax=Streptomyces albiflavescens TaxID=1623582 RepID=A0A917Y873_9ACTN|nr:VOC family protein [Streptomyces albiflavescens]GGN74936.1 glyoxalase [Streptomyces albiflavescens]
MLRGLTTVRFHTTDLESAKSWYTELLGIEPYFDRPGYAEFRIGDYEHELGLLDSKYAGVLGAHGEGSAVGGPVIYWHVDDVRAALDRLLSLGATLHEPIREFGVGFIGASVVDPFGNTLGIMQNRHYLDILSTR